MNSAEVYTNKNFYLQTPRQLYMLEMFLEREAL